MTDSDSSRNVISCIGFPDGTNAEALRLLFSNYGDVLNVEFPKESAGHLAFIQFPDFETVFKVLSNDHYLPGPSNWEKLDVKLVSSQPEPRHEERKHQPTSKRMPLHLLDSLCIIQRKCQSVQHQICKLSECLTLTEEDIESRSSCLQDIMQSLCNKFPQGRVMPFGSSTNNFGYKDCSFDLLFEPFPGYLDMNEEEMFTEVPSSSNASSNAACNALSNILSRSYILSQLDFLLNGPGNKMKGETSESSKQEYVSYFDQERNLNCRIFCSNMLVVHNSQLIKFYGQLDSRILPLALLIRNWAKYHEIIGEKHQQKEITISDTALTWMIIFFLQNTEPPIVPSVEILMTRSDVSKKVLGFEISFCNSLTEYEKTTNAMSIEQLLWEFFIFYFNFDYGLVISPRMGKPLDRKSIMASEYSEQQFQNMLLCVQDPLEINKNLTAHISNKTFNTFLHYCRYGAKNFDPKEKPSNHDPWGVMFFFKRSDESDSASLQYIDFSSSSSSKGCNCVIFFIKLIKVAKRFFKKLTEKEKQNSNYFYELIIDCLLYVFNHTLLFDASVNKWDLRDPKICIGSISDDDEECSKLENRRYFDRTNVYKHDDKEMQQLKRKQTEFSDETSVKRFRADNGSNSNNALNVNSDEYSCMVDIKTLVRFNAWSDRWTLQTLNYAKSVSIDHDTLLDIDKQISLKLISNNEQSAKIGSFLCQCSFRSQKGLLVEISCNDYLAELNLLPFLTYYIPLKLNQLLSQKLSKLKKQFLNKYFIKK